MQGGAEFRHIERQPMAVQYVDHIGQYRDRLAVALAIANHLQGKIETFFQPRRIYQAQHLLYLGILQGAVEMLHRDHFLRRNRLQRVGAGEIHQHRVRQRTQGTHADIHGNPGEIGHFMVQARQPVEQQALAGVGAADEDDFSSHRH